MTTSNDSVTITPGSGATIATHAPGDGKEYQVVMLANADGQLANSNPVYRMVIPSQAVGANKTMCDIFNATGSGKKMKILSAFAYTDIDTAVTGVVGIEMALTRTTAVGTGGTAHTNNSTSIATPTITQFDPSSAALPAQITARASPAGGATGGAWLGTRWLFSEETNAGAAMAGLIGGEYIRNEGAEVIVPENSGLRFVQGAVASVGSISFEVTFELV